MLDDFTRYSLYRTVTSVPGAMGAPSPFDKSNVLQYPGGKLRGYGHVLASQTTAHHNADRKPDWAVSNSKDSTSTSFTHDISVLTSSYPAKQHTAAARRIATMKERILTGTPAKAMRKQSQRLAKPLQGQVPTSLRQREQFSAPSTCFTS
jgi:hypothetical protein